jgi:thiamine pyrophosphokinase
MPAEESAGMRTKPPDNRSGGSFFLRQVYSRPGGRIVEGNVRAIIVAGGQLDTGEEWRRWVREGDLVVGADGGAAQALAWGFEPQVVIGDMDSIPDHVRAHLEGQGARFVVHPRAKDETDLELALAFAVEQGAREIVVLGAMGGRLDHTLSNVLLLALPALEGVCVRIAAGQEDALLLRGGGAAILEGQAGDLVSLLPLGGDVRGVTTGGLAWALEGATLRFGHSRGVSNEMTGPVARIAIDEGYLLVVHGPTPQE